MYHSFIWPGHVWSGLGLSSWLVSVSLVQTSPHISLALQAAVSKHAASVKAQQQATEAASARASLARQVMQLTITR